MPIQHAVLALLERGPSHGYELKGAFEASVGPQWGSLNIGHLYQVLDRLSRDGLVSSRRVAQPVRPDRVVYEITPDGRAELARWLDEPSPRTAGFRDDFFLKVMAAAHTRDPAVVRAVVSRQRAFLLRELRNLDNLRESTPDTVVRLLLAAASRHVSADLAFLDDITDVLLSGGRLATMILAADDAPTGSGPGRSPDPGRSTDPGPSPERTGRRAAG